MNFRIGRRDRVYEEKLFISEIRFFFFSEINENEDKPVIQTQ